MESLRSNEYANKSIPNSMQRYIVFGVVQKIVDGGDLYHIDNLVMLHCMNAAFGEMERGNHRQIHPLQLLQSMHDLIKRNKSVY